MRVYPRDVTHGINSHMSPTGYSCVPTGCHPQDIITHGISMFSTGYILVPTGYLPVPTGYLCYPRDICYPRDKECYPVGTCHPRDRLSRGEHPVVTHGIHPRDNNDTHGIHPRDKPVSIPWVLSRGQRLLSRGLHYPVGDRGYPVGTRQVY